MIKVEMTSKDIERETGKRHDNVIRDIKHMMSLSEAYTQDLTWTDYVNRGKRYQMAIISGELLKVFQLKHLYGVRQRNDTLKENTALSTIEQIKGVKLDRQYKVERPCGKRFFIDGYDILNKVAYEIDEEHHIYQQGEDYERESFIKDYLGCVLIRIKV